MAASPLPSVPADVGPLAGVARADGEEHPTRAVARDGRPWLTAWYPLVRRPLHARVWWDSVEAGFGEDSYIRT